MKETGNRLFYRKLMGINNRKKLYQRKIKECHLTKN